MLAIFSLILASNMNMKSSYGQSSIGPFSRTTVVVPVYMHGWDVDPLTEVCGLCYDRWRYVLLQLVSIGPMLVDLLGHMQAYCLLVS